MCSEAVSRRAKPPAHAVPDSAAPDSTVTERAVPDPASGPAGGKGPDSYVPKPRFEYQAPSMLAQYKYLAIAFVLVIIAATVYLARAPHKPLTIEPPPPPPVYIEPLPERPAPGAR
jgi:hypothetical protein